MCSTFPLGGVIDKQVLGSSGKLSGHESLLHGLIPIDDNSWLGTDVQTVDISVNLPQLGKENMAVFAIHSRYITPLESHCLICSVHIFSLSTVLIVSKGGWTCIITKHSRETAAHTALKLG